MQRIDVTDLDALLREPFLHEDLGTSPTPFLVVDCHGPAFALTQTTIAKLRALPCVTAVVFSDAFEPHESLIAGFDIVLGPAACNQGSAVVDGSVVAGGSVADIEAGITASPHATVTLVQLLRLSAEARVRDALIAESLAYSVLQGGPKFQSWLASDDHPTELDERPDVLDIVWTDNRLDLIFDRPDRHNAFNAALRDSFVEALRVGLTVPDAEVVVSGRGPSFCSGGDLAEFGTSPDPATAHQIRSVRSPAWWVHTGRDRISFEIHGACYGAGIEVPAFAHHVRAASDARLCLPEVAFGLIPGAGGTVSLPRRIGRHRTAWMAISGAPISAATALSWGLVDAISDQ